MLKGFRDFITRGNVVDLAVGVITGALFSKIVTALVDGILNPLIGLIIGKPSFDSLNIVLKAGTSSTCAAGATGCTPDTVLALGGFLAALLNFLLTAAAVYFFIVLPVNKMNQKLLPAKPKEPAEDVKLLTEIRDLLSQRS
ncbi:MAG: large conductance mechanosensitive channel protein MscL [Propionibacteriaceae bacterium]|jgi:large conductance mechanosensitive channel|nr:large conductance mechanosensitive channel protein MscL [Propionibacteriaceae bacterium]